LNDDGHKIIIEELKKRYGQDQSVEEYRRITDFNNIKQLEEEEYREYTSRFDRMKKDCERIKDVTMNKKCNAYMLIERSRMNDLERKMILNKITDAKDPYEESKTAINNIMSSAVAKGEGNKETQWKNKNKDKAFISKERKSCEICKYDNHHTRDCWWKEDNKERKHCEICKYDNHHTRKCWWKEGNKNKCFNCKKEGHIARNCQETKGGNDKSYFQNDITEGNQLSEDLLAILDTGSNISVVGEL